MQNPLIPIQWPLVSPRYRSLVMRSKLVPMGKSSPAVCMLSSIFSDSLFIMGLSSIFIFVTALPCGQFLIVSYRIVCAGGGISILLFLRPVFALLLYFYFLSYTYAFFSFFYKGSPFHYLCFQFDLILMWISLKIHNLLCY